MHGTFEEFDKVTELAASHDIIINAAASFNPPLTEAILKGIRATQIKSHKKPILLHLSGTGNFVDRSKTGSFVPKGHLFTDTDPDDVRKIDESYLPNGPTDALILQAAAAGEVNALFVCPGGIYGISEDHIGKTVDDPSGNASGVWVKWNEDNVEELGFSPFVGDGTSINRLIHVDDVVTLMLLVFQKALDTWDLYLPEDVYKNFYICVADQPYSSKPVAEAFADLQYRRGKIAQPIAKRVTYEEAGKTAG